MGARSRRGTVAALAATGILAAGCAATPADPVTEPRSPASSTTPQLVERPDKPDQPDQPGEGRTGKVSRSSGARADVPDIEIMAQLARRAERIAKNLPQVVVPADVDRGSNRAIGYRLMIEFGFPADQWPFLDALWHRESGWSHLADNPTSSAYGIPQSLPGSKMAVVGADWRTNPETQIRWGLAYIAARYGSAQQAWAHSERHHWY